MVGEMKFTLFNGNEKSEREEGKHILKGLIRTYYQEVENIQLDEVVIDSREKTESGYFKNVTNIFGKGFASFCNEESLPFTISIGEKELKEIFAWKYTKYEITHVEIITKQDVGHYPYFDGIDVYVVPKKEQTLIKQKI